MCPVPRVHRGFRVGSQWVRLRTELSATAVGLRGRRLEDLAKAAGPAALEH